MGSAVGGVVAAVGAAVAAAEVLVEFAAVSASGVLVGVDAHAVARMIVAAAAAVSCFSMRSPFAAGLLGLVGIPWRRVEVLRCLDQLDLLCCLVGFWFVSILTHHVMWVLLVISGSRPGSRRVLAVTVYFVHGFGDGVLPAESPDERWDDPRHDPLGYRRIATSAV